VYFMTILIYIMSNTQTELYNYVHELGAFTDFCVAQTVQITYIGCTNTKILNGF